MLGDFVFIVVAVIVAILVLAVIMRFFKLVLRILATVFFIVLIIAVITVILLVNDVKNFKEQVTTREIKWFLEDNGSLTVGFQTINFNTNETTYYSQEQLEMFSDLYEEEQFDIIVNQSYRVIFTKVSLFETQAENQIENEMNETETTSNLELIELLKSEDPFSEGYSVLKKTKTLLNIDDNNKIKKRIFMLLILNTVRKKGPFFIINGYKKKEILIYPEYEDFKFTKRISDNLWKYTLGLIF